MKKPLRREPPEAFDGLISAAWLYTGRRLIRGGGVRIRDGRVIEIITSGGGSGSAGLLEYPTGLIHPGLVNAHCHLDLSRCSGRVPPGDSFPDWLERVRALRFEMTEEELVSAVVEGLEEQVGGGLTAIADFSFEALSMAALEGSPIRSILLREVIGLTGDRCESASLEAGHWLCENEEGELLRFGLAPHAPYSASATLIRACKDHCAGRPFAIHVSEDADEALFLQNGKGPFWDFLERLGIPADSFPKSECRPVIYLDQLDVLDRDTLLIHANDLEAEEVATIASSGAAVIYCPGTNRFFGRPRHPLPQLLAAGVPAGLGTDSAASNRGLSMAREMREVRRSFPELPLETVWELGTGARLQSFFPGAGVLELEGRADLAVADLGELTASEISNPLAVFLEHDVVNVLTVCGGMVAYRRDAPAPGKEIE